MSFYQSFGNDWNDRFQSTYSDRNGNNARQCNLCDNFLRTPTKNSTNVLDSDYRVYFAINNHLKIAAAIQLVNHRFNNADENHFVTASAKKLTYERSYNFTSTKKYQFKLVYFCYNRDIWI
jgi:hypothetical protein